jgi:hypothetical protein
LHIVHIRNGLFNSVKHVLCGFTPVNFDMKKRYNFAEFIAWYFV